VCAVLDDGMPDVVALVVGVVPQALVDDPVLAAADDKCRQ